MVSMWVMDRVLQIFPEQSQQVKLRLYQLLEVIKR